MKQPEPSHEFTGVFIPVWIWTCTDLSWLEKCLLGEIHALGGHRGACNASNEYLAQTMGMTAGSVAVSISTFRKLGMVKDVSGKGRRNLKTTWEPLAVAKDGLAIAKEPLAVANHHIDKVLDTSAGQARHPKKVKQESSPEHAKFMALWKTEFEKRFNRPYKFTPRDGKAVKNLLNEPNATAQDLMDVAVAAWKTADQNPRKAFYCGKLVEIHQIESQWNKIQDEISPTTRQPAHVSVIEPPHQERHINSALD